MNHSDVQTIYGPLDKRTPPYPAWEGIESLSSVRKCAPIYS